MKRLFSIETTFIIRYTKKKFANTLTTYSIYFNTNLFKFHNHQVHFYPEMHQSPKGWNKSKKVYSTRRIDESTQHGVQSDPRRTRKITKKLNKNSRKNKNLNILIGGGHFNLLMRPVADAVIRHYMHGSLSPLVRNVIFYLETLIDVSPKGYLCGFSDEQLLGVWWGA